MLQWGRVAKDAETAFLFHILNSIVKLQWGRVAKDAETYCHARLDHPPLKLQWGRVAKDAETAMGKAHLLEVWASMGPRREGRGNNV